MKFVTIHPVVNMIQNDGETITINIAQITAIIAGQKIRTPKRMDYSRAPAMHEKPKDVEFDEFDATLIIMSNGNNYTVTEREFVIAILPHLVP